MNQFLNQKGAIMVNCQTSPGKFLNLLNFFLTDNLKPKNKTYFVLYSYYKIYRFTSFFIKDFILFHNK